MKTQFFCMLTIPPHRFTLWSLVRSNLVILSLFFNHFQIQSNRRSPTVIKDPKTDINRQAIVGV
ncbi:TPA_asm: P6 [Arceuthobium sichuanense virus 2]|nr:TPA_asm: P6 [Arceuthobium sichuanense virus 2]